MTIADMTYRPVDAVRTGAHGEITLDVHLPENADYLIAKTAGGMVVAVPRDSVPVDEWALWEDPELRASLWRGFDDAVAGRVHNSDEFLARFDDLDEDDE